MPNNIEVPAVVTPESFSAFLEEESSRFAEQLAGLHRTSFFQFIPQYRFEGSSTGINYPEKCPDCGIDFLDEFGEEYQNVEIESAEYDGENPRILCEDCEWYGYIEDYREQGLSRSLTDEDIEYIVNGESCAIELHDYSHKPFGQTYFDCVADGNWVINNPITDITDKADFIVMGLELEVDVRNGSKYDLENKIALARFVGGINKAFGIDRNSPSTFAIAKHDSSVDYEIVTAPFTYRAWVQAQEALQPLFEEMKSFFKGYHADAGAHVHLPKEAFTTFRGFAFLQFHYLNPSFIATIGQRTVGTNSHWCELMEIPRHEDGEGKATQGVALVAKNKTGLPNRGALNETARTWELRYFRSNMEFDRIVKNIQYCQALFEFLGGIQYSQLAQRGQRNALSSYAFVDYVRLHVDTYPVLHDFLLERGYIPCV